MLLAVCLYGFAAVICIAVEAPILTGVIGADVNARHATTLRPLVFILFDLELAMPEPLEALFVNAAGMGDLKPVEFYCLRTSINENAVVMRNL